MKCGYQNDIVQAANWTFLAAKVPLIKGFIHGKLAGRKGDKRLYYVISKNFSKG